MQWSGERSNAGFSTAEPWFYVNPNYRKINAAEEEKDPDSILNFYRRCLARGKATRARPSLGSLSGVSGLAGEGVYV